MWQFSPVVDLVMIFRGESKRWRPIHSFQPSRLEELEPRIAMSVASAAAAPAEELQQSSLATVHVVRDVVYRNVPGDRQVLDLYEPTTPLPEGGRPVIVAIHGGGWRKFSKEEYEPTVAPFTNLGYIVAVPNYRLSRPGSPTWPTNFVEVSDAVRWVRSHAADLGANPDKIAAMGESAGGHLAALLGTDAEPSARVQAVVDFYGPSDLASLERVGGDASLPIRQYLGAKPSENPTVYSDASPISHVSADDPPFLIVQGTNDPVVVPSQSRRLASRLSAVGVPNRLVMVRGAGHGFGLKINGLNLLTQIDRFLTSTLH